MVGEQESQKQSLKMLYHGIPLEGSACITKYQVAQQQNSWEKQISVIAGEQQTDFTGY